MASKRGGVIGIGGIGIWHAQMMRDSKRIDVVGLCDSNPAMAARAEKEFPGVPFHTDVAKFLAKAKLDVVAVVVPHDLHCPIAVQCLAAKVNVIVEKPMATSFDECQQMIKAAKKAKRFLTVFHNRRHDGWFLAAKSAIDDGLIGKPIQIDIAINFGPTAATWRGFKRKSGGIMYDWGAHLVDYALHFAQSEVKAVSGFFYRSPGRDPELNEEHGSVRIHFANGAIANLTVAGTGQGPIHRYFIVGTKGTLVDEWNWGETDKLKVHTRLSGGEPTVAEVQYQKTAWQKYYDGIAASLCDGAPLLVTPESAAKVINVFSTAERSFAQGGVPLPLA